MWNPKAASLSTRVDGQSSPRSSAPGRLPLCLLFGPWPSVAPGGRRCRTIPRLFCECSSPSGQGLTLRLSLSHSRIWGASLEGKGHGLNAPSVDGVGKGPCFRGFPGPSARPSHRRSSLFPDGSLPSWPDLVTRWAWQKAVSFSDGPVVKNLHAMQEPQGPGFSVWVRTIPCRRAWQPIPVSWPGEFHGQRSLAGYSPQGHRDSDMTQ